VFSKRVIAHNSKYFVQKVMADTQLRWSRFPEKKQTKINIALLLHTRIGSPDTISKGPLVFDQIHVLVQIPLVSYQNVRSSPATIKFSVTTGSPRTKH